MRPHTHPELKKPQKETSFSLNTKPMSSLSSTPTKNASINLIKKKLKAIPMF